MLRAASHCCSGGTMVEISTRRGREMMPIVLIADMDWSDSTLGDFTGVEKKLQVAFGARETAGQDAEDSEAARFGGGFDGGDRFFVERWIFYYAAFADVFAAEFELGFDQNEKCCAGFCGVKRGRKDFC